MVNWTNCMLWLYCIMVTAQCCGRTSGSLNPRPRAYYLFIYYRMLPLMLHPLPSHLQVRAGARTEASGGWRRQTRRRGRAPGAALMFPRGSAGRALLPLLRYPPGPAPPALPHAGMNPPSHPRPPCQAGMNTPPHTPHAQRRIPLPSVSPSLYAP